METEGRIEAFTECLEMLLMKMQEADNSCVEVTKDISKREFSVVIFVGKNEDVIMKDIADFLNIPVSTTTGVVDKLVEKGYIKRFHSEEDRRSVKIALSKFGSDVFQLLESALHNMSHVMLKGLDNQEQSTLVSLLAKITSNLKNYVPSPTPPVSALLSKK